MSNDYYIEVAIRDKQNYEVSGLLVGFKKKHDVSILILKLNTNTIKFYNLKHYTLTKLDVNISEDNIIYSIHDEKKISINDLTEIIEYLSKTNRTVNSKIINIELYTKQINNKNTTDVVSQVIKLFVIKRKLPLLTHEQRLRYKNV